MIKVQKWDFKRHIYRTVEIDDKCSLYEDNLNKIVNCANCNKQLKYGDCYTSKQYHNNMGFGYAVCEECYNEEWKERKKYERN